MAIKVTSVITGAKRWHQASRMMDEGVRSRVRDATSTTVMAVTARARVNVPVSTPQSRKAKARPGHGELRDTIRGAMSTSGLSGSVMAGHGKLSRRSKRTKPVKLGPMRFKAFQRQQKRTALKAQRALGIYAMVVNYGSPGRGIPATHFMDRAKESERAPHIARIKAALRQSADAAVSGLAG